MDPTASPPPRTCRYGHGGLQLQPEVWTLAGAAEKPMPGHAGRTQLVPKDAVFALELWICPACGYVELSDHPVP